MGRIVTTIDVSGPFFRVDPARTFRENVRVLMEAIAREGEQDVRAQLASGASRRAPIAELHDRVADHVRGRVDALRGRRWTLHAVISVNNVGFSRRQGISLMAAASRVEGQTHAFRRTTTRLRAARAINTAELAKGLT